MVRLEPGMVCSNEPGYYKEGAYGIRIENLVLVTELQEVRGGDRKMMGFETLTLAPIDRRLIVKELLSADESTWLDAYHARVLQTIGPEVDTETRAWLAEATAPL
jgi:Xaa-Pro aminopeptidase